MAVSALQRRAAHLVLQQALYSPGACTHSRGLGSVYITCTHTFVCLFVCVSVCDISISFYSFVHALEYLCKYAYISIYIRRYVYLREVEIYPVSHPLISPFLSHFLLLSPAHTRSISSYTGINSADRHSFALQLRVDLHPRRAASSVRRSLGIHLFVLSCVSLFGCEQG